MDGAGAAGGGGTWPVWVSSPSWTLSFPVARLGRLQRAGSQPGGNLGLVLRAVGVTGSARGADRKRGLEGKGSVGSRREGGSQQKGAGEKVRRQRGSAGWAGAAAADLRGKQRVTPTSKRGEPREWECGSP